MTKRISQEQEKIIKGAINQKFDKLTTEQIKEFFVKLKTIQFFSDLKSVEIFSKTMGNKTKLSILILINKYHHHLKTYPNKSDVHEMLKEIGHNISYKNTLWNLDRLREGKMIYFKKDKKKNNSTLIIPDKKLIKDLMKQITNFLQSTIKEFN